MCNKTQELVLSKSMLEDIDGLSLWALDVKIGCLLERTTSLGCYGTRLLLDDKARNPCVFLLLTPKMQTQ
jgi:hypothetical protein